MNIDLDKIVPTNFIEEDNKGDFAYLNYMQTLNLVLDIPRFGFKRVSPKEDDKMVDLFFVTGRVKLFKDSSAYNKYFEWYKENVSKEEVEEIYHRIGMEFEDLKYINNTRWRHNND